MKQQILILWIAAMGTALHAEPKPPWNLFPFAPAAGQPGSTAIYKDDPRFIGWADGYENYSPGKQCAEWWRTPQNALGKARCGDNDPYGIVCLGSGGQITLTFSQPILNGAGYDFAVFENGFTSWSGGDFLELAWVEVSSDGIHFVRFPNYSATENPVPNYGNLFAENLYNLASKYIQAYGHPFDLSELQEAYDQIQIKPPAFFTDQYTDMLTANFPHLDLNNIRYVRLVDIVGDGSALDTAGNIIYDAYPTLGSAGFDLDAIGVLHQRPQTGELQTITFPEIPNQKRAWNRIALHATSDRGLPIRYSVQSGPATLRDNVLTFTGSGTVAVFANQPGDENIAPAAPVLRTFAIAEELQHIWFEPIPNQLPNQTWQLHAVSSSGLPVACEISRGPRETQVDSKTQRLYTGSQPGLVRVRASQSGNATTAPAADVFTEFEIVEAGSDRAPVALTDQTKRPQLQILSVERTAHQIDLNLTLSFDPKLRAHAQVQATTDLTQPWSNAVPQIVTESSAPNLLRLKIPIRPTNCFFRIQLQDPRP